CLTSESLGGRSANRGQCAQACRLPYEIICDGEDVDAGSQKYLLSPQDLAAYALIPELLAAGVTSFKIEGRLKTPEYVANITSHYRQALDQAIQGHRVEFTADQIREMEQSFSRGFSVGWLQGCDHKALVPATSSAKRGVLLGEVTAVSRDRVSVNLQCPVQAGDGVVFEGDRLAQQEQGGRVYHVCRGHDVLTEPVASGVVELTFDQRSINLREIRKGLKVWKTDDPRLNRRLRESFAGPTPHRRVPLSLQVTAHAGRPLIVQGTAANGAVCHVETEHVLAVADRHPATKELLTTQLGRLGGTIYELQHLTADLQGTPMIPHSILGGVRRELIGQLANSVPVPTRLVSVEPMLPQLRSALPHSQQTDQPPSLLALCRTLPQLQCLLETDLSAVYVDFADPREYREALAMGHESGRTVIPATPRIQKPGEMGLFRLIEKLQPPAVLVRNLSGLRYFHDRAIPVIGDFSLNVTNELTAEFLMQQGTQRVTA
ncbi:MAG: U32 family peptidase, partial [Planctomycetaceae bacterium]|nr:U32 family peptidase [Planctomycetaceae bacterium]